MPECTRCGEYTKYVGGLCYECYKEKGAPQNHYNSPQRKTGAWWVDNVIKGRIAETIIAELFKELGFQVFRYGMENTIPGITELLRGNQDKIALEIRRMPDFVVFKNGKAHFIEVKFRKNESFALQDLEERGPYPYENVLIVVVSQDHIKCISFQELKAGKEITPNCHNYLGNRKEFETDKDVIVDYCDYALKFFETV